ncbi:MAG TPA: alanine racemase [Bacteroidetes bacterium]|nr:alanine racemase [Bacteroidota bacterium]
MCVTNRRDFFRIAGSGSVAVVLTGASALSAFNSERIDTNFNVVEQIDPWIELNMEHLASNVNEVRRKIGKRPIMAVIKCNAYGHGAVEIATALQNNSHIQHFAVVKVREALTLRQNNIRGMILNMGPFNRSEAKEVIKHRISQAVYSDAVDVLAEEARKLGKTATVHIYLDTGLGRVGVPHRKALAFIEKVSAMPEIKIEGIFTGMTEDDEMDRMQIERITAVCEAANMKGINVGIRHAAASAEVDRYPFTYLDMVRPGNCLVGLEPERQHSMKIRPVMSFKTRVIYVKKMYPGESISYHRAYKITKETLIATLPCGYSDGYPPVVLNKADVLIRGRRYRTVAPITANHTMVDITGAENIRIGDEVVLWGKQGKEQITKVELEMLAPNATNTYRMATRTRSYLPRVVV